MTRTIELVDATRPLADYAEHAAEETLVITVNGQPIAAVVPLPNTDLETIALSSNPDFLALIARSREQRHTEGGLSADTLRQRLGLSSQQSEESR
jgi:antitoxin (DNA-binding transcriptional repressor) of toxin-antitoxin stability system